MSDGQLTLDEKIEMSLDDIIAAERPSRSRSRSQSLTRSQSRSGSRSKSRARSRSRSWNRSRNRSRSRSLVPNDFNQNQHFMQGPNYFRSRSRSCSRGRDSDSNFNNGHLANGYGFKSNKNSNFHNGFRPGFKREGSLPASIQNNYYRSRSRTPIGDFRPQSNQSFRSRSQSKSQVRSQNSFHGNGNYQHNNNWRGHTRPAPHFGNYYIRPQSRATSRSQSRNHDSSPTHSTSSRGSFRGRYRGRSGYHANQKPYYQNNYQQNFNNNNHHNFNDQNFNNYNPNFVPYHQRYHNNANYNNNNNNNNTNQFRGRGSWRTLENPASAEAILLQRNVQAKIAEMQERAFNERKLLIPLQYEYDEVATRAESKHTNLPTTERFKTYIRGFTEDIYGKRDF